MVLASRSVGIRRDQLAHGFGERTIGPLSILRLPRIADAERIDIRLLAPRRLLLQVARLLNELERRRLILRVHRRVDVRSQHERVTPVRHRAVGIEARGFGERAGCLGVIESVRQVHALIDEELRTRRLGRHLEGVRAQVLQPGREGHAWR